MNSDSPREPRLRERFRQEVTDLILGAAERVFAEHGLHAASMNEIAARAGVAVGTLYNHFKDRSALLEGLTARRKDEMLARLDARMKPLAHARFRVQLEAFVGALVEHIEAHRPFLLIMMQESPSKPTATARDLFERCDKLVKRGLREKALRTDGAALLPSFLLGLIRSIITRELFVEDQQPLTRHVPAVVEFFLSGAGA